MDKIRLSNYWEMLNKHDWYHMFSDDSSVDRRGEEVARNLLKISAQSPEHLKLFNSFQQHYWTGEPWNTKQTPKPEKPNE